MPHDLCASQTFRIFRTPSDKERIFATYAVVFLFVNDVCSSTEGTVQNTSEFPSVQITDITV